MYISHCIILKFCYNDIAESVLPVHHNPVLSLKAAISSCRPQVALRLLDVLAVRTDGWMDLTEPNLGNSAKFARSKPGT